MFRIVYFFHDMEHIRIPRNPNVYLSHNQVPFKTIAGKRKPNTADWLMFLRSCVPYVMGDAGPVHPREAYMAMIDVLNAFLEGKSDYDPDEDPEEAKQEMRRLHVQTIEALCLLERDFPLTELSIFVHEILHVPEFIYRWNAVRNYWCFVTERFVGWMKSFVQNRSLSIENMVPLYVYFTCSVLFTYLYT